MGFWEGFIGGIVSGSAAGGGAGWFVATKITSQHQSSAGTSSPQAASESGSAVSAGRDVTQVGRDQHNVQHGEPPRAQLTLALRDTGKSSRTVVLANVGSRDADDCVLSIEGASPGLFRETTPMPQTVSPAMSITLGMIVRTFGNPGTGAVITVAWTGPDGLRGKASLPL